ncbi:MAG: hypothetical protein LBC70_10625 [Chitinispirillales bacterium]|jgi:hypothetical protein|nr:hypothetical protein [Chitinispirillales bacterium]
MKAIVLDGGYRQSAAIREAFAKKGIDAVVCSTSNEFLAALSNTPKYDTIYINAETWNRGRAIYDYFGIGLRLEDKPAVIYNADEKFAPVSDRRPNEQDRVFYKPSGLEIALGG